MYEAVLTSIDIHVQFTAAYKLGDICANNGKLKKVRPQSRTYMVIEYSLHKFTRPPSIVLVKRICQQETKVAFMHIYVYIHITKRNT